MNPEPGDITRLLSKLNSGDPAAANDLIPLVYDELRSLASRYLRRERPGHTLQPTALVHEACLKLIGSNPVALKDRAQFMAIAAIVMRRILVDYARAHAAGKRGGRARKISIEEVDIGEFDSQVHEILDLDAALERLRVLDSKLSKVVELRYFGGLTVEECAEVVGVSPRTIKRDWMFAKTWLRAEIAGSGE